MTKHQNTEMIRNKIKKSYQQKKLTEHSVDLKTPNFADFQTFPAVI